MIFDESDVETVLALELDVGSGEDVKGWLLEATFCGKISDEPILWRGK